MEGPDSTRDELDGFGMSIRLDATVHETLTHTDMRKSSTRDTVSLITLALLTITDMIGKTLRPPERP
jgi:hypothetical protein